MAISTQDSLLVWRKVAGVGYSLKPYVQWALTQLKRWHSQFLGNPDLQLVQFSSLSDSETVIADAACKLYALVLQKAATATATFSKLTNSATTSSDASSELRFWSNSASQQDVFTWPNGLAFATGITMQGNTTANGGTSSGTDACSGFCIIGAP